MRMFERTTVRIFALAASFVCVLATQAVAAAKKPVKKAEPVRIDGYADEAMEPFISRDGRFLFFNTRNDPGVNTNLHFAEADGDGFKYRGILYGTISYDLDAVATMAADGRFCFVSPRDYRRTRVSVLCGVFDGNKVNGTIPQPNMATGRIGRIVFDVEMSADAQTMIFAEGTFSGGAAPDEADLYLATLAPRGYERVPGGEKLFANINTSALEYAPGLSADGLELYFTRLTGIWPFRSPTIFRAARRTIDEPWGKPVAVKGIDGFVEGPSVAPDGAVYFHKRVGGRFQIWRLPP